MYCWDNGGDDMVGGVLRCLCFGLHSFEKRARNVPLPSVISPYWYVLKNQKTRGSSVEWLSWLSICSWSQLLISGSWVQAPHCALHWAWSLLSKETNKNTVISPIKMFCLGFFLCIKYLYAYRYLNRYLWPQYV